MVGWLDAGGSYIYYYQQATLYFHQVANNQFDSFQNYNVFPM